MGASNRSRCWIYDIPASLTACLHPMAGNVLEQRGREHSSRERDSKRVPTRIASRERARSPRAIAVHDSRPLTTGNTRRPRSPSPQHTEHQRSRSPGRRRIRERSRRRSPSPDERGEQQQRYHHASHGEKAGDNLSRAEHRQPSSTKRRHDISPTPSHHYSRHSKRRRSHSRDIPPVRHRPHDRSYSPRPTTRDDRATSPEYHHHQSQYRRRSRSVDSRHRYSSSRYARQPSPSGRTRPRESGRDRRPSPPRYDRRRYTPPPPNRRGFRDERDPARPSNRRGEELFGTRHSKPAPRSPARDARRSESPSDRISQLATTTSHRRGGSHRLGEYPSSRGARRLSRSPPPPPPPLPPPPPPGIPRREHRDEVDYREGERASREFERSRHEYPRSPRREHRRDGRDDDDMYGGRGGYPRGPPPRPYVDPRYSHSPPYGQPPPAVSPPNPHSPYGRGGYPAQAGYGSYQG